MTQYILQRSDGLYLGKDLIWAKNSKNNPLFHCEHQDIALNKLIELNAKDITLRAKVISCDIDATGNIICDNSSNAA
jgi:hypothetical protein